MGKCEGVCACDQEKWRGDSTRTRTDASVAMFLRENMALYRSKREAFSSQSVFLSAATSLLAAGGAGSTLMKTSDDGKFFSFSSG